MFCFERLVPWLFKDTGYITAVFKKGLLLSLIVSNLIQLDAKVQSPVLSSFDILFIGVNRYR